MSDDGSLDVLMAQLQIKMERLESVLVTSPRRSGGVQGVVERIVAGLSARNISTVLYLPASTTSPSERIPQTTITAAPEQTRNLSQAVRTFTPAQAGTPQLARDLLTSPGSVTVAVAPGVLEDPTALFLAAAADAVLLVVESRRTTRVDLRRARVELESAGAHLEGAVIRE